MKLQVKTNDGEPIAEWVVKNHKTLKVKYVIWGRRIWEADSDSIKDWSKWTSMKDEGDNTANHWYVILGASHLISILTKRPGTMFTSATRTDLPEVKSLNN